MDHEIDKIEQDPTPTGETLHMVGTHPEFLQPLVKKLELHDTTPILQLVGISSLELASKLIGLELYAHQDELPLEEDTFYYHSLVGCTVVDQNKLEVGTVKDVLDTGIQDLLVIARDGKDYLVPVQAPYVRVLRNLIEIDVFPGLLDDSQAK